MATRRAVTNIRREKSHRTAGDAQPIPTLSSPSARKAQQFRLGDAGKLVQWLNASEGTASHERVTLIRREIEELPVEFATHFGAYVHTFKLGRSKKWPKEKMRIQLRNHNRHAALNELLEKYVYCPRATYVLAGRRWMFGMVPYDNKRWFQIRIGYETITEADAVIALIRLAQAGDLRKIRQCGMCKERWLVAAKRNYRFCSHECRETFYAKAPDYHSRKAANQRKYRENLKRTEASQDALRNLRKEK